MAKKIETTTTCDMRHDGEATGRAVTFAVDGIGHEIDLCALHEQALLLALADYLQASRKPGNGKPGKPRDRKRAAEIRRWARGNGHQVNNRGRIPATVVSAFDASSAR
ncbi:MAG TPA: histone-like nucleoid-structuring protein Lsr2 [Streptosporangiaceae bacterium]|nr:histone-like nucleoid-structuring protein Lsr2 [Streptosporangiaceae bacterium]